MKHEGSRRGVGWGGRPHWEINMKHVIQFNIKLLNKF